MLPFFLKLRDVKQLFEVMLIEDCNELRKTKTRQTATALRYNIKFDDIINATEQKKTTLL